MEEEEVAGVQVVQTPLVILKNPRVDHLDDQNSWLPSLTISGAFHRGQSDLTQFLHELFEDFLTF